jgi:hypothetical protein
MVRIVNGKKEMKKNIKIINVTAKNVYGKKCKGK